MMDPEYRKAGGELLAEVLAVLAPVVDGKPSRLVVDVMAHAMMSAVLVACPNEEDKKTILLRYAARIVTLASEFYPQPGDFDGEIPKRRSARPRRPR